MTGSIEEIDETELPAVVIDLNEYRRQKAYQEFWNDPCWKEDPHGHQEE